MWQTPKGRSTVSS